MLKEFTENYNLINYIKIIDISLLNLFDYLDLDDGNDLYEVNGKLVLNFNSKIKKNLENFIINNINDNVYYGKTNILVDTCSPKENWRNVEQIVNKNISKYILKDDSIFIDELKMNMFFDSVFKKLKNSNSSIGNEYNKNNVNISFMKKLYFIDFKSIDIIDSFGIISNILSNFGNLNKDGFNFNLIKDGNHAFMHECSFVDELTNQVRLSLMKKGII